MTEEAIKEVLTTAEIIKAASAIKYPNLNAQVHYIAFARAIESAVIAKLAAAPQPAVQHMVNRFLAWKLPKEFYPDSFISFDREQHDHWGGYPNSWPTGTNLFTGEQAKAMFEYCLEGAAPQPAVNPQRNKTVDLTKWAKDLKPRRVFGNYSEPEGE